MSIDGIGRDLYLTLCQHAARTNLTIYLDKACRASKMDRVVEMTQKNDEFNNKKESYAQKKSKRIRVLSACMFKLLCVTVLFMAESCGC